MLFHWLLNSRVKTTSKNVLFCFFLNRLSILPRTAELITSKADYRSFDFWTNSYSALVDFKATMRLFLLLSYLVLRALNNYRPFWLFLSLSLWDCFILAFSSNFLKTLTTWITCLFWCSLCTSNRFLRWEWVLFCLSLILISSTWYAYFQTM